MSMLERNIQIVKPGKWAKLHAIDKEFDAMEAGLGFPPKTRYQCMIGGHSTNTLVIEREWESLAVMEATYLKTMADAEYQKLGEKLNELILSSQIEVYMRLP